MSVYVDDMFAPFRRMTMCHMIADAPEELREFAAKLGLRPQWIQAEGTHHEHFDVGVGVRMRAIAMGAQPISMRELVEKCQAKRSAQSLSRNRHESRSDARSMTTTTGGHTCR